MALGTQPALLERETELAALDEALRAARSGGGRLVVLEGAAGIGKTRLLRELRDGAGRAGVRVLAARGSELERDFPFGVVRQLFEPVVLATPHREREPLLTDAARPAAAIIGAAEDDPAGDDALVDPSFSTLNALYWLTSNLAESGPMLLAVDDAHWADSPSLRFLRFLVPRLEELPVLLAVAARPSDPLTDARLLAELTADPAALVVKPRELSRASVTELVRAAIAADAEAAFCAACHEATGGNPFLLRELLGALADEGARGASGEAAHVREVAPEAIRRAALVRLARLDEPARRLAHAVAVLGDDAHPPLAAAFAGLERAEAAEAGDALVRAGILEAVRPLRFLHPLLRTAVYADVPPGQRALDHDRAATLLDEAGAEPEDVAAHLLAADPRGSAESVRTLSDAARRALDRAAPEAAVRYLRRALDEPPPDELRPALLRNLATAAFRASDATAFGDLDPVAELTADPATLVDTAAALATWLVGAGRRDDMNALLARAAATAADTGRLDDAMRLEAQRVTWMQLPPAQARAQIEPYAARIEPGSAGERLWLVLQAWWTSLTPGASAAAAADLAEQALAGGVIFRELSGLPQPPQGILVLIRGERVAAAEEALRHFEAEAREHGTGPMLAGAAHLRGELALLRGDVDRGVAETTAAVDASRQANSLLAIPLWLATNIEALVEHGELDAADAVLAESVPAALPAGYWFTPVRVARGRLRLEQARPREALDDLEAAAEELAELGMANSYVPLVALIALARAALGHPDRARSEAERAVAVTQAWGAKGPLTATLRALGLVAGGEEGLAWLAQAVEVSAGSPAQLEHARALADYGAALRRANRRADAREPLHEALALARRGGALPIARRAHEELEATGERVKPLAAGGIESLTPSERRIAGLAAEGRTNREIAQSLFLTVKTVEGHLSNAYRKLGVKSRRELGRVLDD